MRLVKRQSNEFDLCTEHSTISGSLKLVSTVMEAQFGFDRNEILIALADLDRSGNDTAHFGVGGGFLYSAHSRKERYAMVELRAIGEARAHFHVEQSRDRDSKETKEAADRLMHLYIGLDVDGIVLALEQRSRTAVA